MVGNIRCVEVEIHSFCNRKCEWCPNSLIDRMINEKLDERLYIRLLKELKKYSYQGVISYSRYNEPMSRIKLFKKRVKQAREILGEVKLVSNTNGDFLTKENLMDLDIDELTIMDYDSIGVDACIEKLISVGAAVTDIKYPFVKASFLSMKLLYYVDWPQNALIVDRGGLLKNKIGEMKWANNGQLREKSCLEPLYFVGVDFTGDVTPCCQIRGDNKQHLDCILGNLTTSSLEGILTSHTANEFRYNAMHSKFSGLNIPCRNCQKEEGRYTRDAPSIDLEEVIL